MSTSTIIGQQYAPGQSQYAGNLDIEFNDPLDTVEAKYFLLSDKDRSLNYRNSKTLNVNAQIDFTRYKWNEYLHLGNVGSAAVPIVYDIPKHIDLDFGFHQYDAYKKSHSQHKYFNLVKPISDLYFAPNGTGNFTVKALFADQYEDDIKLSLDYARINEDGSYTHQKTKSTAFSVGLLFDKSEKYKLAIEYLVNNHNEENNMGVSDTTVYNEPFNNIRQNIPVFNTDASTRHQNFSYRAINEFLLGGTDNLINGSISLTSNYKHGYFRFFDNDLDESDYVGLEQYLTDDRGVRCFLGYRSFENDLAVNTSLKESVSLRVGTKYIRHRLDDEIDIKRISNLILYGQTQINISDKVALDGRLELGFGNAGGSLDLKSKIDLPLNNWVHFTGGFNFIRLNPNYIHENLIITQVPVWKIDYTNPIHTQVWGELQSRKLKSKLRFSQILTDGLIFMNQNAAFEQLDELFTVTQLSFTNEFNFKSIHLDNHVQLQAFNNNVLGLPEVFIKQRLYFDFKLFKSVLNNQIGVEHRFMGDRNRLQFNHITGHFYPTDQTFNYYPSLDLFALFSIGSFKFLLRADNLYFLFNNEVSYHIWPYPQNDYGLRISVNWIIND